jgi:hypothetical protein
MKGDVGLAFVPAFCNRGGLPYLSKSERLVAGSHSHELSIIENLYKKGTSYLLTYLIKAGCWKAWRPGRTKSKNFLLISVI